MTLISLHLNNERPLQGSAHQNVAHLAEMDTQSQHGRLSLRHRSGGLNSKEGAGGGLKTAPAYSGCFHFPPIFQYSSSTECVCIFNEAVASEQFQAEQDFGLS